MINYCLPIIKDKKKEVLNTIERYRHAYSSFEIWSDYIGDLDNEFVKQIAEELREKSILLFRRQSLKSIQLPLETRKNILQLLDGTKTFVDLDISTQDQELEFLQNKKISVKIILSYHNYNETPDKKMLIEIIKKMERYKPEIYKIATFCKSEEDALLLLQLLLELKREGKRYIVLGMGEKGIVTRIYGTLWGNAMTFAPDKETELSAPGQLTKQQLEEIFKIVNTN